MTENATGVSAPVEATSTASTETTPDYSDYDYDYTGSTEQQEAASRRTSEPTENATDTTTEEEDVIEAIKKQYGGKKIKTKYKGQETELSIEELLANPAAVKTVNEAMQEKAKYAEMFEQVKQGLLSDPIKALAFLQGGDENKVKQQLLEKALSGIDIKDRARLLEQKLIEDTKYLTMSPEEKAQMEMQQKLRMYEEQERRAQEAARQNAVRQEFQKQQEAILHEVSDTMKELGLPEDDNYRMTILREAMGLLMYDAQKAKQSGAQRRLSVKKALEMSKDKVFTAFRKTVVATPAEQLVEVLGPEIMENIRKHLVAQYNKKKATPAMSNTVSPNKVAKTNVKNDPSQPGFNMQKFLENLGR